MPTKKNTKKPTGTSNLEENEVITPASSEQDNQALSNQDGKAGNQGEQLFFSTDGSDPSPPSENPYLEEPATREENRDVEEKIHRNLKVQIRKIKGPTIKANLTIKIQGIRNLLLKVRETKNKIGLTKKRPKEQTKAPKV